MDPTPHIPTARIVIDLPTRQLSEPFDYLVPERLDGEAAVGAPVVVPFGGQHVLGYVVERGAEVPFEGELKALEAVVGPPAFLPHAFGLARWVAREYVCPLADALRLFLPPGGTPSAESVYAAVGGRPAGSVQGSCWEAIAAARELGARELRALDPRFPAAAATMVRAGIVARTWRLRGAAVGAVDDRWAALVPGSAYQPSKRATAQRAVLDSLSGGPVRVAELSAELGSVDGPIKALESAGAVRIELRRRMRGTDTPTRPSSPHEQLSEGQDDALRAVLTASPGACILMDGVTGSGKTEVYLRAIERTLEDGRGAIVLVPEISLTPQTVGRFRGRFGDTVAVLHSRLSPGERFDQWDRVRSGEARVVIGPRSALCAPVRDLGIVILDEEHDGSYKQGSAPRYHARSLAERLVSTTGAVLVLGSATPSFESRVAADQGRFRRVRLPERVAGGALPPVTVVDMAEEFRSGHRSMFSRILTRQIGSVASEGTKAVLFLNRRGFASFVLCRECGHVPRCPACSVSLTYHEVGDRLVCHHCGRGQALPARCPSCSSPYLRQFGAGTQRVEAELHALVPDLPVVRMDADTTRGKGGHERQLIEFESMRSGILLGTQMVAKGLDYADVVLVGVINADTTLHMPDFRASERTYQLLEQVSGRAGRGRAAGSVVIQTYWPDHPAIVAAAHHDPASFYEAERSERSTLGYPPFGRLARIVLTGKDALAVAAHAAVVAQALRDAAPEGCVVLGPGPAPLSRVKGSYRWQVLLKGPAGSDLPGMVAESLRTVPSSADVAVAPDIDPLDMM